MGLEASLGRQSTRFLSVFRIVLGFLFFFHGASVFFGVPPWTFTPVIFPSLLWFQGIISLVGGSLIALGLYTRAAAFVLAGDMAVAYFMVHAPRGFFPHSNGGLPSVLYCFSFLYLFFAGGGAWSLDRLARKSVA